MLVGVDLDLKTASEEGCDQIEREFLKGFQVEKFYQGKGTDNSKIKDGFTKVSPHLVSVSAHGGKNGLEVCGWFANKDADDLANPFPFVYVSMSCLTNAFDEDSLSEHFMNNPKGGAVAFWACSRYGWYNSNNEGFGQSELFLKEFFRQLLVDPMGTSNSLGEVIFRARTKYLSLAKEGDYYQRWLTFGMNLLGDPEMPVWTEEPREMMVKLEQEGDSITATVTDKDGPVRGARGCIRFEDATSLKLTLTARNRIPREWTVLFPVPAGVYDVQHSDSSGKIRFTACGRLSVIQSRISELVSLDSALNDLENHLKTLDKNGKTLAKLTSDHQYLLSRLEQARKEIQSFLVRLVEEKRWLEVGETLTGAKSALETNPAALNQVRFIVKTLSEKIQFEQVHTPDSGEESAGCPAGILQVIADLEKTLEGMDPPDLGIQTGNLLVTSDPSDVEIYLDNIPKGKTPCTIEGVPIGTHSLKAVSQGFVVAKRTVAVSGPGELKEHILLKANCSVKGKVSLPGEGPAAGVLVQLKEHALGEGYEVIATATTDEMGIYRFSGLGRKDFRVDFSLEGYNPEEKPFFFDSFPDQGFNRVYDFTLIPLCTISGKISDPQDVEIRFFKDGICTEILPLSEDGSFSIPKVARGSCGLGVSRPGHCPWLKTWENSKGEDRDFGEIVLSPIIRVRLCLIRAGLASSLEMKPDGQGLYTCKVTLPAYATKPVGFYFLLNKDLGEAGCSWAFDPDSPIGTDFRQPMNILNVPQTKEYEFRFDSRRRPIFFRTEKDTSGKEIWIVPSGMEDPPPGPTISRNPDGY